MKQRLLLVLAFVGLLCSCAKDETEDTQKVGEFSLAVTSDASIETKASSLPSVADFKVQILSVNGGEVLKEWAKYSDMPSTVKFAVGSYVIKAFHGDSTLSAFEAPSFSGQARFTVAYQGQKNVAIKCTHNRTLVAVEYADGFMKYYKDWSAEISTSDDIPLTYLKDEGRVGYFPVAPLKAKVTVTRSDDKRLEAVMPVINDIKAAQLYTIHVDVKDGAGGATFNIIEAETNNIVKSVEVPFTAAAALAPYYVAKGFSIEDASVLLTENREGVASSVIIKAGGKVKSCMVDVISPFLISKGIPVKFDLSTTSDNADLKGKLEAVGLKWSPKMKGSTMAEIDFTEFTKNIPADIDAAAVHSLIFTTTDEIDGVSPAVKVDFTVENPKVKINNVVSVSDEVAGVPQSVDAVLNISVVNGLYEEVTSVEYKSGLSWVATDKFSISEAKDDYNITINGLPLNQASYTLRLIHTSKFGTKRYSNEVIAEAIAPEFKIELVASTDRTADFRVTCVKGEVDFNKLKIDVRNQGVWETENVVLTIDEATNSALCTLIDLTPSEKYRVRSIYDGRYASHNESLFTTNIFSFESWNSSVINNVQKGGRTQWKQKYKKNLFSKVVSTEGYYEPTMVNINIENLSDNIWSTVNDKTARDYFTPKNSWCIVPSASKTDGVSGSAVSVRSVIWDNEGVVIMDGAAPTPPNPVLLGGTERTEGIAKAPNLTQAQRSSGELFIGKYACIHDAGGVSETRNETGIKLRSKPVSIKGSYRFEQYGTDVAYGVVEIMSGDEVIGKGEITFDKSISEWSDFSIKIMYTSSLAATSMKVKFISSKDVNNIQINITDSENCVAVGNVLDIDELKLNY